METLPLSNESFSYSWLIHLKPPLDGVDDALRRSFDLPDDGPFIELELRTTPPFRTSSVTKDFDFNFSSSQPLTLVPADQLFLNGHLLPLHRVDTPKTETLNHSVYLSDQLNSPELSRIERSGPLQPSFMHRCRKSSKKILWIYWRFLKPIFRKIRELKDNNTITNPRSASSSSSRVSGSRNCTELLETTPRKSVGYDGMSGAEIERSIQSAILHCKKSIGIIDNLELSFTRREKPGR